MKFFWLFVGFSFLGNSALSWTPPQRDLNVNFQSRSYPFGFIFGSSLGVSTKFWEGNTNQPWQYGYVRAAINAASVALVNRIGGEIQFYPVSIFGFGIGQDWTFRNFTPKWVDCSTYQCTGRMHRQYIRGVSAIGAKGVAFLLQWRYERTRTFGNLERFFDEVTIISGRAAGETELTLMPLIQYKMNNFYSLGAMALYSVAMNTRNISLMTGPLANFRFDAWSLAVGVGTNRSTLVGQQISGFLLASVPLERSPSILETRF